MFNPSRHRRLFSTSRALSADGPLKGVKILDFSRILAGPYCSQVLADYGATVTKVEQPGLGDETRSWAGSGEGAMWKKSDSPNSLYFASVNRNKRSLTLNLKKPESKAIVKKLVENADVVLENFIPGGADKLGIGYKALSAINPRLIYASLSGYGSSGPYANRAGYDAIAAAEGGLMHITGHADSSPVRPGLGMTDMATGLYTHGAILAALLSRQQTGKGQHISSSLFETQISLLINVGSDWLNRGVEGKRYGAAHPSIVPYNTWMCADGTYLTVAANNQIQYEKLCKRIGRPELVQDERFASNVLRVQNRNAMEEIMADVFAAKTADEWLELLDGSGLAHGRVNTIQKAFEHPQIEPREMVKEMHCDALVDGKLKMVGPPVKFSETPGEIRTVAPQLGEHTMDILREAGYAQEEIEGFRKEGVV